MICPKCGKPVRESMRTCPHCGVKLTAYAGGRKGLSNEKIKSSIVEGIDLDDELVDEYKGRNINNYKKNSGGNKAGAKVPQNKGNQKLKKNMNTESKKKNSKKNTFLVILIALAAVLVSVAGTYLFRENEMKNKYQKYIKEGRAYYNQEDYSNARTRFIEAARNASSNEQQLEVYSLLYNIDVVTVGDYKEKIEFLEKLIQLDNTEVQYYKDLYVLYQNHDMESQIDTLKASAPPSVRTELDKYVGTIPRANPESGEYNTKINLELLADDDVTIYYTKDGSDVTESDSKIEYSGPIKLKKEGSYTIRACSIDKHGVSSKEVIYTYTISFVHVEEPEISVESGSYRDMKKIEATAEKGCTIYYTTDGSTPNKNSKKYKKPIEFERGNNLYRFVAINENGIPSEVVDRVYDYTPKYDCTYDSAVKTVKAKYGELDEYNETADGKTASFDFVEVAEIDKQDYYIIEYSGEEDDDHQKYAVSTKDGSCHKVSGSNGDYDLK
ncbi:MAG: chitobiase/beta-hexosaminidase C-terminal domain-containing protein [Eubacterium sp.]|nr:chitobiase/beta-hexosaminidase C-terminal domain-containing protein [Eubacterium sp.]